MGRPRTPRVAHRGAPEPRACRVAVVLAVVLALAAAPATADTGVDRSFASGRAAIDLGRGDEAGLALALGGDERVYVAGRARGVAGDALLIARFTVDGMRDASFAAGGAALVDLGAGEAAQALVLGSDGSVLVAGSSAGDSADMVLARLRGDGTPDLDFGERGSVVTDLGGDDRASALAAYPDGRVLVAGSSRAAGRSSLALVRHLASGRLDPDFGAGGRVLLALAGIDTRVLALALAADGRILVIGAAGNTAFIARRRADGTPDPTLGDEGVRLLSQPELAELGAALVDSEGRIVLAGSSPDRVAIVLARVRADGSPDPSFGDGGRLLLPVAGGSATVRGLATDPHGNLVVVGSVRSADGDDLLLARATAEGAPDSRFGDDGVLVADLGGAADDGHAIAVQRDGRIVVTGATGGAANQDVLLARFTDGAARCGDAALDPGEACDHGARNGAPGSCCAATCALRSAGEVCRSSLGACDPAEVCDGAAAHCPDDAWARAGAPCRDAAGACDVAETCSGAGPECPRDQLRNPGAVCRVATGACDLDEKCDGVAPECPADRKKTSVCRSARGSCDQVEWCDGAANDCPVDVVLPDGSACEDGNACTVDDLCVDAECQAGTRDPLACRGYLCATAKGGVTTLAGEPPSAADLGDESGALRLRAARSVCVPALTSAEDPGEVPDEDGSDVAYRSGYTAYGVSRVQRKSARKGAAARGRTSATLEDQFGALEVGLAALKQVSVPAAVDGADASVADSGGTRYQCHEVSAGSGLAPGEVSVRLRHDDVARRFAVRAPRQVCRAVGSGGDGSAAASDDVLVCYSVKAVRTGDGAARWTPLVATNPYETWLVSQVGPQHLCVPAEVISASTAEAAVEATGPRKRQLERKRKRLARGRDPDRKRARRKPRRAGGD